MSAKLRTYGAKAGALPALRNILGDRTVQLGRKILLPAKFGDASHRTIRSAAKPRFAMVAKTKISCFRRYPPDPAHIYFVALILDVDQ